MRRSRVLALMAVGGASYAATISSVGGEFTKSDPSTWRWQVSSILDEQKKADQQPFEAAGAVDPAAFGQRHGRYTPLGAPDAGPRSP
jgi:hypothetical protein